MEYVEYVEYMRRRGKVGLHVYLDGSWKTGSMNSTASERDVISCDSTSLQGCSIYLCKRGSKYPEQCLGAADTSSCSFCRHYSLPQSNYTFNSNFCFPQTCSSHSCIHSNTNCNSCACAFLTSGGGKKFGG